MSRYLAVLNMRRWPTPSTSLLLKIFAYLIVCTSITAQAWMYAHTKKGMEPTLSTIRTNENCKSLEVTNIVGANAIQTITRVTCTKSGEHEILMDLPPYFKKQSGWARPIAPSDYESQKRLW